MLPILEALSPKPRDEEMTLALLDALLELVRVPDPEEIADGRSNSPRPTEVRVVAFHTAVRKSYTSQKWPNCRMRNRHPCIGTPWTFSRGHG